MTLERVLAEIAFGNGAISWLLIRAHQFDPNLKNLVSELIKSAGYILSLDRLTTMRKMIFVRNIVEFLTEYVKRRDSIPCYRIEQRKLKVMLKNFCSPLEKIDELGYSVMSLTTAITMTRLGGRYKPKQVEQDEKMESLKNPSNWKEKFKWSMDFLEEGKGATETFCRALEKVIIGRLKDIKRVSVSDFAYGIELFEQATCLGMYAKSNKQKYSTRLEAALRKAATVIDIRYNPASGEQLCDDMARLLCKSWAHLYLSEVDGCDWGQPGKEYLNAHLHAQALDFNRISWFLIQQVLAEVVQAEIPRKKDVLTLAIYWLPPM